VPRASITAGPRFRSPDKPEIEAAIPDGAVLSVLDGESLRELTLAYAITLHKSQGVQFPEGVVPMTTSHYKMLNRNLLYTGITRAQERAVLVGTHKALGIAVGSRANLDRQTGLRDRLVEQIEEPAVPQPTP